MRTRLIRAAAIVLLAAVLGAAAGNPPRLVVDNRTNVNVMVQIWRYTGDHWDWQIVSMVAPHTYRVLTGVNNGDHYRALGPWRQPQVHVVTLYADKSYGGWQDIWLLR